MEFCSLCFGKCGDWYCFGGFGLLVGEIIDFYVMGIKKGDFVWNLLFYYLPKFDYSAFGSSAAVSATGASTVSVAFFFPPLRVVLAFLAVVSFNIASL